MNDVIIQFQGFHPSELFRSYLESRLSELHDQSPYGSTLRVHFTRHKTRWKATLRIMSPVREFFAVAEGRGLHEVSKRLFSRIHRQLERWKSRRFEHRSLLDLEVRNGDGVTHGSGVA
ncbi:HPF/RaiA family ribosome-associated protein [Nocardioides sp.]|uniref:HPF/RaiA family ribosome-associated protein n=1 Tax=Nocardioides sp. TaxID=35761 RepID=UPI003D10ABB6